MDNDKLNITIRIADLAPMPLCIERDNEETVRSAENRVNQRWKVRSEQFKDKDSKEILAMVAYECAKLNCIYEEKANEMVAILENFEKDLDDVLLKID